MIDKLLEKIPEEQLEKLRSSQVSYIVLWMMESLNPMLLLLFEKHYTLRKDYTEVGLNLKIGREQELLYLQELLVPVQQFLEEPQMKGIILPKLLGTLQEAIDIASTDLSLLNTFGDLIPQREAIFSYLEQMQQLHLPQNESLDLELVESWNPLETLLLEVMESPILDILKDLGKMESPQTATALAEKIFTILLIPMYEYEYFLFLKKKIQNLGKEEKPVIEVEGKNARKDKIVLEQTSSPNFESTLIDGLVYILMPYFTEETDGANLKALFEGGNVERRLFFHGPGNRFVEVFRQLHEKRKIYSNKRTTCDWICQHFCFLNNKTKEISNFKEKPVYNVLSGSVNPTKKANRIDLSPVFDRATEKK